MSDQSHLTRSGHFALELIATVVYQTPDTNELLIGLGLEPGPMGYFAGRSAAMGAVGAAVVTATFASFSPELVGDAIPRAWSLADPAPIAAARFEGVDRALRHLWGNDAVGSAEIAEAAELARKASEGGDGTGRPLFAAHAGLPWPREAHLVLWHASNLLREHRGDGHIAALVSAGLSGLEALITHTATGTGFTGEFARTRRGWSIEDWSQAQRRLVDRGLVDHHDKLTARGKAMRRDIEDHTDALASAPWLLLGTERAERLRDLGRQLSERIVEARPEVLKPFSSGSPLVKARR